MKREDLHIGQTVYLLRRKLSNSDDPIECRIHPATIKSIGKKYLTVEFVILYKFDMENDFTEVTEFSPMFKLFISRSDALHHIELEDARSLVRRDVDTMLDDLPYEAIQAIREIFFQYGKGVG